MASSDAALTAEQRNAAQAIVDGASQQSAQIYPTARVLIGKRISDRAHLTLSRALSGANDDLLVVLEYDQSGRPLPNSNGRRAKMN